MAAATSSASHATDMLAAPPTAPEHWITIHKSAVSSSLAAAAVTYAVTATTGRAATAVLSTSVRVGGAVCATLGHLVGGTGVGLAIQAGSQVTAEVVERTCESATHMGSFLASSLAAAAVGSTVLISGTLYDMYTRHRQPTEETRVCHVECIERLEEVKPNDKTVYMLTDTESESPSTEPPLPDVPLPQ